VIALVFTACVTDTERPSGSDAGSITIPDLTGLSPDNAVALIDHVDLDIRIEPVDVTEIDPGAPSPGVVVSGRFARDVVLKQEPPPDTKVASGATVTLFVPYARPLRPGERKFRLLTHCGLSYPLEFEDRFWLPVDPKLRRTIGPPEGFTSDGYHDAGTVRRIDRDTLIYTSSTGIEVRYEPTDERPYGCE